MMSRRLLKFGRTTIDILRHPSPQGFNAIIRWMHTRVVPESILICGSIAAPRTLESTSRVLLELISSNQGEQIFGYAVQTFESWHTSSDETKQGLQSALKAVIANDTWPMILRICSALMRLLSDEVRKPVCSLILPALLEVRSVSSIQAILAPYDFSSKFYSQRYQ
jgi:hypothetical protein